MKYHNQYSFGVSSATAAHRAMSTSDPRVDVAYLPQRKEKRIAVVVFLILALFGSGFMFARTYIRIVFLSLKYC